MGGKGAPESLLEARPFLPLLPFTVPHPVIAEGTSDKALLAPLSCYRRTLTSARLVSSASPTLPPSHFLLPPPRPSGPPSAASKFILAWPLSLRFSQRPRYSAAVAVLSILSADDHSSSAASSLRFSFLALLRPPFSLDFETDLNLWVPLSKKEFNTGVLSLLFLGFSSPTFGDRVGAPRPAFLTSPAELMQPPSAHSYGTLCVVAYL